VWTTIYNTHTYLVSGCDICQRPQTLEAFLGEGEVEVESDDYIYTYIHTYIYICVCVCMYVGMNRLAHNGLVECPVPRTWY